MPFFLSSILFFHCAQPFAPSFLSYILFWKNTAMSRVGIASGDETLGPSSSSSGSFKNSKQRIKIDVETLRLHALAFVSRISSRIRFDTLRPLPLFLGIHPVTHYPTSEAFSPPVRTLDKASAEKLTSRLKLNLAFFVSNYAALSAVVATVVGLLHPGMLLAVGGVWALWAAHHFLIRHELVVFGVSIHALLTIQQRFYLVFAITVLVVVWKCLKPTLLFAFVTTILIGTHALLRDPKHIEASAADWLDSGAATNHHLNDEEGGITNDSGSTNSGGGLTSRRSDAL
jgi:hypothetical protein